MKEQFVVGQSTAHVGFYEQQFALCDLNFCCIDTRVEFLVYANYYFKMCVADVSLGRPSQLTSSE